MDPIPGSVLFILAWAAFPLALGMITPVMLTSIELSMGLLVFSCILSLIASMKATSHRPDVDARLPYVQVLCAMVLVGISWWSPLAIILAIIATIICFHAAFRVCDIIHRTEREVRVLEWDKAQPLPVKQLQEDGWTVFSGNWRTGIMARKQQGTLSGAIIEQKSLLLSTIGSIAIIEEE